MTPFWKMNGLGNDFVVLDGRPRADGLMARLTAETVRLLCDRRRGLGCDQLIVLGRADAADAAMAIFNADGGPAGACGNATRCVARLLAGETGRGTVSVETAAGTLHAEVLSDGRVRVDMGSARLDWREVPLSAARDTAAFALDGLPDLPEGTAMGIGNPHVTFFVNDAEAFPLSEIGPAVERHDLFPERVNCGVAHLAAPDRLRLRVWERGAGITPACGTGACAAAVAAMRRGMTGRAVTVDLDGGSLDLFWREDGHVLMTGSADIAVGGTLSLDALLAAAAPEATPEATHARGPATATEAHP
jgi:diaminopimelate epimerase